MGILGKKKTTTQVIVDKLTGTKIVKLTYRESLILRGNLNTVGDLSGVTQSQVSEVNSSTETKNSVDVFSDKAKNPILTWKTLGMSSLLGAIGQGLFGRKKSTDINIKTKESGWTVVKTWAQAQFDVIRYAIGIKDLAISQFLYEPVSEIVSTPWYSPKEITKVYMIADQFIPSEFPSGTFVEYYIKPDIQDFKWIRINPMELPSQYTPEGTVVPRIISFNSERPVSARLEESYVTTNNPVTAIRVRIVLKRPSTLSDSYTPIINSYRLIMTPRGGL